MARGFRLGVLLLASTALSGVASAQTIFGYQVGATQSVGGTFGDNQLLLLQGPPQEGADAAQVRQLQGVLFNTAVNGNVTMDVVSSTWNHGLVLGVAATQIIPTLVPEDLPILGERITTLAANGTYLARLQQARWSLQLGAGYAFGLNGRLEAGADGSLQGNNIGTLPAANAGAFAFNGMTHALNGQTQLQLTRTRWDLTAAATYTYTQNGIYTLAGGPLGAPPGQGAQIGTNLGAFVPANVHGITPALTYRQRLGSRGVFIGNLQSTYSIVDEVQDSVIVSGVNTVVVPAPPPPPETLINSARLQYDHNFSPERTFGVETSAIFGLRLPTDAGGASIPGLTLSGDTLITTARAFYRDTLPWGNLRLTVGAGAAQAHMFQPPFGVGGDPDLFDPIRSNWIPVFDVSLQRRFEPVDINLLVTRTVGVGALGASAVVVEGAALTFNHVLELRTRRLISTLGFTANRTEGVGRQLFRGFPTDGDPAAAALLAAFDNVGLGLNAGMTMPLWTDGPVTVDGALAYNFNYIELAPSADLGIDPLQTHTALFTLRAVWGRGTAQGAAGIGGRTEADELDAFSANPRNGSPLVSSRLLRQGAPMMELGSRPGAPPEARRDSRQAYQQSLRQQQIEREARERMDIVQGVGSYQDEERRAQIAAEKELERRREERTREFGAWPSEDKPLPVSGDEGAEPKGEERPEEPPARPSTQPARPRRR